MDGVPPKVIHIKFGNPGLKEFVAGIGTIWKETEHLISAHATVYIYLNKIEAIK